MTVDFVFLDSGTGGIPYMQYLKRHCPDACCVYVADTANFPYGEKNTAQIISCASDVVKKIRMIWNPRAIVVACNTISVTALEDLRSLYPETPFIGTVPAIKLAAAVTRNKKIGLLATNGTVAHPYIARLAENFASNCTLFSRGDADLVSFVEHKFFSATPSERLAAVQPAVSYFKEHECDTIILGCTHFIHMADYIAAAAGTAVSVIDSRDGVVRQALKVSKTKNNSSGTLAEAGSLYVTGFHEKKDEDEYKLWCSRLSISWGGILGCA